VHRVLLVAVPLVVLGAALVALPDDDRRLFSISRDHGPSALDTAGVALVLAGWGAVVYGVWRRRARVLWRLGTRGLIAAACALVAGVALIAWSVAGDHGAWWVAGVAVAAAPQVAALIAAR
jgi:uncharacterized membrane protein YidH (DUF202 family)